MNVTELLRQMTLEEKASLCSGRDFWQTKAIDRLGIPSVMMCDGPHGLRKQEGQADHLGINKSIETVCYPSASALAASFDREQLKLLGTALGRECRAEGVAMLLGPGVNMKRSPLCGRNFEYFSEDPYLAGELAASYIEALQAEGVAACVKHFAANNQETRRLSGSSNLSERTLHEIYLPAFEAAVKQGKARGIMCAYNGINGTFCSENKQLLTGILREKWGYEGFVVTDWGAVKDRVKGLKAGLDLEMPGGPGTQDARIVQAVREGRLEEAVVDRAAGNVLKFILESAEAGKKSSPIDRAELEALSANIAENCAVLLKNEGILPLKQEDSAAFIGEFAAAPRYQGAGSSHINVPHPISALEAAGGRNITYARGYDVHSTATDPALLQQALEAARNAKVAVIFAGLPDSFESEGDDRTTLDMPENQNALIEAVCDVNPNTVMVYHGGSCARLPWLDRVKGLLSMHLGGSGVGAAAVRLLYGETTPSGKLAETWPMELEDNPSHLNFPGEDGVVSYQEDIFIGYRYYDKKKMAVRFPFGFGLSYTAFRYSGLKLDKTSMEDTDTLTVTLKVKNTGSRPGREAVQLYVRDEESTVRRPVRELKGFQKIALEPGEEKEISFRLSKRAFAYYEPKLHDWFVETGRFQIDIGASSRDIRLSAALEVRGTGHLPRCFTRHATIGEVLTTEAGRRIVGGLLAARSRGSRDHDKAQDEAMGEGSQRMRQKMMMEMPLNNLVTYGVMTFEQLDALLAQLNG